MKSDPIAVAYGDGIGPEIMQATLLMLQEAGARLDIHPIEIGEKVYLSGQSAGISSESWQILRNTKAFLKAPITTPQGGGFKSLNVTVRATLGLFANVRPCISYTPFIKSHHNNMDIVIIRENEEDLYTGVEYRSTSGVYQALKTISKDGSERIIRYAFEYARKHGRKKVTCFSKDNILKLTDGLFHSIFDEISQEYPDLEKEHWIVDIGSAKLADTPEVFDVIVTANLYGDIISDIAAQIAGSVGLAGSANIGMHHAMFEAIHGSAPRRAGQNLANPSGLLMGSLLMLEHLGQNDVSTNLYNAWAKTIEEGIHTYDIYKEGVSKEQVGTKEFAKAVILRLGQAPEQLKAKKQLSGDTLIQVTVRPRPSPKKTLRGIDLCLESTLSSEAMALLIQSKLDGNFELKLIANRGIGTWPQSQPETLCVDHWRVRLMTRKAQTNQSQILKVLSDLSNDFVWSQVHLLFDYDDKPGYTLSQSDQ
jgi:isocitrate dehydrogenase